eukprot:gene31757-6955_t
MASYWKPIISGVSMDSAEAPDMAFGSDPGSGATTKSPPDMAIGSGTVSAPSASRGVNASVCVRGLRKEFVTTSGASKVAVDSIDLDFASGKATIYGLDVGSQMHAIQESLGTCPQFDILWPGLTVQEHLGLYASIKGMEGDEAKAAVLAAAREVQIQDLLDSLASQLSGGQRRKLSVAIAFMGQPSVVFLDEPTSGMDPYSRRFTWDVILRNRRNSVLVLTTHSMEEADVLADRIVIMVDGRVAASSVSLDVDGRVAASGWSLELKKRATPFPYSGGRTCRCIWLVDGRVAAAGSSLDLKNRYGVGYTLTASLLPTNREDGTHASSSDVTLSLTQLVKEHLPDAEKLVGSSMSEVSFRLPREDAPKFPSLLRMLDACCEAQSEYGISSYGLSVTSMEEVFMSITKSSGSTPPEVNVPLQIRPSEDCDNKDGHTAHDYVSLPVPPSTTPYALATGRKLWLQRFYALVQKRALSARRDRLAVVTQLLVPMLMVGLAMWVASLSTASTGEVQLGLGRVECMAGAPTVLAAPQAVRDSPDWSSFTSLYGSDELQDSNTQQLWSGGSRSTNDTLEEWLMRAWYAGRPSYDALFVQTLPSLQSVQEANMAGPAGLRADVTFRITILVNQTAIHALPTALQLNNQAIRSSVSFREPALQARKYLSHLWSSSLEDISSNDGTHFRVTPVTADAAKAGLDTAGFRVASQPLPILPTEPAARIHQDAVGLVLVLCLSMASSVLSASFAVFLVRERSSNSKHLQMVTGTPLSAFWLANICWDYLVQDEMIALQRLSTSFFLLSFLGFLATWIAEIICFLLRPPRLEAINHAVKSLLRTVSPHFCLARAVFDVTQTYTEDGQFLPPPFHRGGSPFAWEVFGAPLAHMMAQAVVYSLLVLLVDCNALSDICHAVWDMLHAVTVYMLYPHRHSPGHRPGHSPPGQQGGESEPLLEAGPSNPAGTQVALNDSALTEFIDVGDSVPLIEDVDVRRERKAVQERLKTDSNVLIDGLRKSYYVGLRQPRVKAVKGLWLGKTTAFKMLTGEILPESGDAFVCGYSIRHQLNEARQHMGYCPQFEALPGALTGKEVLTMYAKLRGVPERAVEPLVQKLLGRLGLLSQSENIGGNMRKLNVGVALQEVLGRRDERTAGTSSGPDLSAGWDTSPMAPHDVSARATSSPSEDISQDSNAIVRSGGAVDYSSTAAPRSSVVITSHSMEEAEALCSHVGILASGWLKCVGSMQHIKGRFGCGEHTKLANMFEVIERERSRLSISTYCVSQATLDQV